MSFNPILEDLRRRASARRVFLSYHHGPDRAFYEEFSRLASDVYECVEDRSVRTEIDSENPEYVMRRIRENYITGTSCTIVLCGAFTWQRKYVDWEIKASLDKRHGLIGLGLPTAQQVVDGLRAPDRLVENHRSGYATWHDWSDFVRSPGQLADWVEAANSKSSALIVNTRPMRSRNG